MNANSKTIALCDYCGLPCTIELGGGGPSTNKAHFHDSSKPTPTLQYYCCYGCRFAAAIAQSGGAEGQSRWLMTSLGWSVFCTMNVMAFTMCLWSQPDHSQEPGQALFYDLGRYVCLLFTTPVVLLLGLPLMADAWDSLRRGRLSMSLLLGLGVSAAFAFSVHSVVVSHGDVYFEVCCMVLVVVTLGRWLEATGKLRTTQALRSLERFLPEDVRVIRDGEERTIPRTEVQLDEVLRIFPGERIPVDGQIVRNYAEIDEQAVTGEAVPATKGPGDPVFSGTLNLDGDLTIQATSTSEGGTLQRIIAAVTTASAAKEPYQRLADWLSIGFLPLVAVVALATFGVHWNQFGLQQGILAALAVVVISCPCALGLATPMAIWAALGCAARRQVLIRDGDALSRLAKIDTICFDKTGTLTSGKASVIDFVLSPGESRAEVARVAAQLASTSAHPFSKAILNFIEEEVGVRITPELFQGKSLSGRGVTGALSGIAGEVALGSSRLMLEMGMHYEDVAGEPSIRRSHSLTYVGWGGKVRGIFALRDELRPEAVLAVTRLQQLGIRCLLLSGDRQVRAQRVGELLGIEVYGDLLPAEKLDRIRALRGKRKTVAMVGDGINDAPALAAAEVGISLASGTDISRETAAVCLLRNDLLSVPWLVSLSKKTVRTIRWNLAWAFFYNIVGIGIAAAGKLNPVLAALAMVISSILVVTNSLQLAAAEQVTEDEPTLTTMVPPPLTKVESTSRVTAQENEVTL